MTARSPPVDVPQAVATPEEVTQFLAVWPGPRAGSGAGPELAAALGAVLGAAPATVDRPALIRWIAERLPARDDPAELLRAPHRADLVLAFGCARAEAWALEAFEQQVLPRARGALAKVAREPDRIRDLEQQLREHVLLARPDHPARIAEFTGDGPLASWVAVVAMRLALRRAQAPEAGPVEDLWESLLGRPRTPEDQAARRQHQEALRAAFEETARRLTVRERTLLRLHLVDGLNGEQIAALYGVHRSSVSRWVAACREQVLAGMRARLAERLGMGQASVESLVRDVQSQIDLSLSRVLAETPAP